MSASKTAPSTSYWNIAPTIQHRSTNSALYKKDINPSVPFSHVTCAMQTSASEGASSIPSFQVVPSISSSLSAPAMPVNYVSAQAHSLHLQLTKLFLIEVLIFQCLLPKLLHRHLVQKLL